MERIGVEINLKEGEKIAMHQLSQEVVEQLGLNKTQKTGLDYLKEFISNDNLYDDFQKQYSELSKKSIPEDLECDYCLKKSTSVEDKACTKYYLQMNLTLHIASAEFVQIVLNNKHIFKEDSSAYQRLAKHFINSLRFVKGEGILWLDLAQLIKLILSEGFISLSKEFAYSDKLQSLQLINNTLDDLNTTELLNDLNNKPDGNLIPIQRKFFMNKQNYLKETLQLEELQFSQRKPQHKHTVEPRPDRTDIAFFAYYTSETGSNITTERFPSVKAWKVIAEKYQRHYKNIQSKYNEIRVERTRITTRNIDVIQYVIDNMLNEYPNAKSLAEDELKLAKLK